MKEVLEFFRANPTFFLATVDDGQARIRPFGAVAEFEGNFYICTNNQKKVYSQMMKCPQIELCGIDKNGQYCRVTATVCRDERIEAKEEMLKENPVLNGLYQADDGKFEVFYLKDATAAFATIAGVHKEIKF